MKILMINSVCGIKSTGRICTDIAELIVRRGHECRIAYGRDGVPDRYAEYAVRIGTDTDVKMHALCARIFDNSGFCGKKATSRFIEWVKEYDPDIIHLHNLHGYYIDLEQLFKYLKASGKPVIWTLHDCWSFTGHCAHFDYVGCKRWQTGCYACPQKGEYPKSVLFDSSRANWLNKKRLFSEVSDMTLVTPSSWLAGLVGKSFLKEFDLRVINNGIDLNAFKIKNGGFREKYDLIDKKIVLGVASVWSFKKGLNDFSELYKILDPNIFRIVLVGVGEEDKNQLDPSIIRIGRTNNVSELAEIYSAADVFVNPTYEDTFPTTNIEALACGTPVITYDTGGSPEIIDESCGIAVERGNVRKLAKQIEAAVMSGKFTSDMCVNRAAKFDMERCCKEYLELYEKKA